jgi:DNA-directed RNA polymerase delta subunit
MENIQQMSMLEVAVKLMNDKKTKQPISKIIEETLEMKGLDDEDGSYAAQLYIDITTSSLFVYMGDEEWDLKSRQSLDEWDKDGSAFNTGEEEDDEEESADDFYSLDDNDDDDENEEGESVDEYDPEVDEDDYDDDDEEDDDEIERDELVTETYDEDDETKYMDEDSYNDIMDDYEDMYDKD